jgi:phosphoribosyl-ATP pyrophosphohydrolase
MIDQAVLQREIETLPPKYIGEVVDFVGYLQKKAQQEAVEIAMAGKRDKEIINRYADELNKEMEDVLSYQTLDI